MQKVKHCLLSGNIVYQFFFINLHIKQYKIFLSKLIWNLLENQFATLKDVKSWMKNSKKKMFKIYLNCQYEFTKG